MKSFLLLASVALSAMNVQAMELDSGKRIIYRRVTAIPPPPSIGDCTLVSEALDENHPAVKAASRISDEMTRTSVINFYKNMLAGSLSYTVAHPTRLKAMLSVWKNQSPEERPFLMAGILWDYDGVSVQDVKKGLEEKGQLLFNSFSISLFRFKNSLEKDQVVYLSDDKHAVTLSIQKDENHKTINASFYDSTEGYSRKSLEQDTQQVVRALFSPEYAVNWEAHYTGHQKDTAFGECTLYSRVYKEAFMKGEKPEFFSDAVAQERVTGLKKIIRSDKAKNSPLYFKYLIDEPFQRMFDSGFADYFLEEIKKMPPII